MWGTLSTRITIKEIKLGHLLSGPIFWMSMAASLSLIFTSILTMFLFERAVFIWQRVSAPFTNASHFTVIGAALQSSGSEFCDSVNFREDFSKQALEDWWKSPKTLPEVVQSTRQMCTLTHLYSLSVTLSVYCAPHVSTQMVSLCWNVSHACWPQPT